MPIYCEHIQIVIPKAVLEIKYKGGVDQFKKDYHWKRPPHHEDNELISIASMENAFPTPEGLHYDSHKKTSQDFVIVARYGAPALSWEVDWCLTNKVFIWHKDCRPSSLSEMHKRCALTVDEIAKAFDLGEEPFADIY